MNDDQRERVRRLEGKLRRAKTPREHVDALNALADEHRLIDTMRSLQLSDQALQLAEEIGYEEGIAHALTICGVAQQLRGDINDALDSFKRALSIREELEDVPKAARLRANVAIVLGIMGKGAQGLKYAKQSLRQLKQVGDVEGQIQALISIGLIHVHEGLPDKALPVVLEAMTLLDSTDSSTHHHACLSALSSIYRMLHDYPNALAYSEKLLALCRRDQMQEMEQRALAVIGWVYEELCDYAKALEYYMQAFEVARSIGDENSVAMISSLMSGIHSNIGNYDKALELLQMSEALIHLDGPIKADMLGALGDIHADLRHGDEARRYYRQSIALLSEEDVQDHVRMAKSLKGLGYLAKTSGDLQDAEGWFAEALNEAQRVNNPGLTADCHLALGDLRMEQRDYPAAVNHIDQAMEIARRIDSKEHLLAAHTKLSEIYEQRGKASDVPLALAHFKEAARLKEEILGAEKQRQIFNVETRAQIEQARREREIYRLENEKLQLDMEHKVQELNAMAVHLSQKQELLDGIRRELGDSDIVARIEQDARADADWEAFEARLEEVHRGFLGELSRQFPKLTPAELKVCALLKTQLPSKEIANLLNVSARAVEKHRWNIRKKLGLSAETNLVSYLAAV